MDQELHTELTKLHVAIALVVQRTDGLPDVIGKLDDRVTELEEKAAAELLKRKKLGWAVAGGAATIGGLWTAASFLWSLVK